MKDMVAIIGGGESGVGAALLAKEKGYKVFLSDYGSIPEKYRQELIKNNIPFEEKGHTFEKLLKANVVIKSPGVNSNAKPIRILKENGIQIISEIEFGFNFYSGKIVAVTGSNGKTTTSGLLYHIIHSAGLQVGLGGNYGTGFCRLLLNDHPDIMVLELSSFQLEDIVNFHPSIAILLNITPDHLDRYDYDIYQYGSAKMNIIRNQTKDDLLISNGDDNIIKELLERNKSDVRKIEIRESDYNEGVYSKELDTDFDIKLIGKHNLFNACCAIRACQELGISDDNINYGLKTFVNAPHRLETVAVIDGVKYINDSKATNVDAVYYALDGIQSRIVWIAGGTDKGNDYTALYPLVDKVKSLICLGIDNKKLQDAFHSRIAHITETQDIREAVKMAVEMAEQGEVVLLSPACASFDLFKNYMDRGDQFKEAVWGLISFRLR